MVVPGIVDTVAREEIQDTTAVRGEQFTSQTTFVANVHLQQIQQANPLRVHVFGIESTYGGIDGAGNQLSPLLVRIGAERLPAGIQLKVPKSDARGPSEVATR